MNPERSVTNHHPRAVLVVDDSPDMRRLLGRWLTDAGYEVLLAENAADGLQVAMDCAVSVAVCDVRMPGRDGVWLAEQLTTCRPGIRVVFATAVEDLRPYETLRPGVSGYIVKPLERREVVAVVARALAEGDAAPGRVRRYLSAGAIGGDVITVRPEVADGGTPSGGEGQG